MFLVVDDYHLLLGVRGTASAPLPLRGFLVQGHGSWQCSIWAKARWGTSIGPPARGHGVGDTVDEGEPGRIWEANADVYAGWHAAGEPVRWMLRVYGYWPGSTSSSS